MTSKPRHVRRVTNAACAKCDRAEIALLCAPDGRLFCLPCLLVERPNTFQHLQTWMDDHRTPLGT